MKSSRSRLFFGFPAFLRIWILSNSDCMILRSICSQWQQLKESYATITKGSNWCSRRKQCIKIWGWKRVYIFLVLFKWDILCPFLQYISLRCPQNASVRYQFKIPYTYHLLYNFENVNFEWKQKTAVFVHVSLNANELLLPAPFAE